MRHPVGAPGEKKEKKAAAKSVDRRTASAGFPLPINGVGAMKLKHATGLFLLALCAPCGALEAQNCSRVLVSGFDSTVHIYSGCNGEHLGNLDAATRLSGPQAIRVHEDHVYVVAEAFGRVERYRADTLEHLDTPYVLDASSGITGISFDAAGAAYVGRYAYSDVLRFATPGGLATIALATGTRGLRGPDNGLVTGPDGWIYVPGFDSDSVLRFDPVSGESSVFIAGGSGGLRRTRGLLFEPDGGLLVTSEGSNQILRYRADGSFDRVFANLGVGYRPTGIDRLDSQTLLVTGFGSNRVTRVDALSGAVGADLVASGVGGLYGATFLAVLPPPPAGPDLAQVGSQYWVAGAGSVVAGRLVIEDMQSATGAMFGSAFDPSAVQRSRWGRLEIEFSECSRGQLSWDSTGADSARFGRGGYPLRRLLPNAGSARCEAQGLSSQLDPAWMAGVWYGGDARSGEGLFIDVSSDGVVSVAFFTHRPPASQ
jgi:hypothetical protein